MRAFRSIPPLTPEARARIEAVVREHYAFLWRSLRRLGVPRPNVEDAAHEVLLVLVRRIAAVHPGAEKAFLFGTALRVASSQRRPSRLVLDEAAVTAEVSGAPGAEEQLRNRQLLDQVLEPIPLELRAVLVLVDLEELTMAQAAELLGIPAGTVASRLKRAREQMAALAAQLKEKP